MVDRVAGSVNIGALLGMGVYILWQAGKVVYVGKSKCMLTRVGMHRSLARRRGPSPAWLSSQIGIVFDDADVIPCHPDRIDALEQGLIKHFTPRYNVKHNPLRLQQKHANLTHIVESILKDIPPPKERLFKCRPLA